MKEEQVEPTGAAEALAHELRAINAALALHEIEPERLATATRVARELRAALEGPPRARWYQHEARTPSVSAGARASYGDMSPVRGRRNPVAPPLAVETLERPDGSRCVVGRAVFSRAYEGPPHGVHGGFVAALFDELLGAAQGLAPPAGVTATLEVRYRHLTPIEEPLRFEAWIDEDRGKQLVARATCHAGDTLTAQAKGLFVRVDFEEVQRRMAERRSD
jgi:acyl-coenzyme A thioesterase PaaI-like protein